MPRVTLVLGPLLRYAGTESATFWVETSAPCEVEILGRAHADVHGRGSPLRAAARRRPRAGLGDAVRGSPRRRARLAAGRRPSAVRRPHAGRRAARAAGLRLVPGRRARSRTRSSRRGTTQLARDGSRRPLGVLEGASARRGGMARRTAAARRPGLRRRGLARDARLHRGATGHERAARRAGRRLRGVHAPLPRVLVATRTSAGCSRPSRAR